MLLNESGIRLPKGAKSAKVLAHQDLDGFVSALLIVNQIQRQGIPKDRINIEWVQYGDNDLLDKATRKNKHQAVVSVDFSAYPTADLSYLYSTLARTSGGYGEKFERVNDRSFADFKKEFLDTGKTPNSKQVADFIESKNPHADVIKKRETVDKDFTTFMKALKAYKVGDDHTKVKITDLDYVSDHHDNSKGDLVSGKAGQIGRTQFKSDSEHIATVAAQGLMDNSDIKEISVVDSAGYKDVENTISMSENLRGKGGKERLAVLVSALITSLIKSNKPLTSRLVKESSPSLLSIYTNAIRISKLNDNQLKIFSQLKKEEPDWELINKLKKDFSPSEQKKIFRDAKSGGGVKPTQSIKQMRDKNLKSKEQSTNAESTRFEQKGVVLVQNAGSTRDTPPRYMGSLLSKEEKRFPFILKRYSMLVQVQGNANLNKTQREEVDLGEICKAAVDAAEKKFGSFSNKWAWDIIRKESGGHKTIWNISGITVLGSASLSAAERSETKYIKGFERRVKKLSRDKERKKRLLATKGPRLAELDTKKAESPLKTKAVDFMVDYIIKELNAKYSHMKVEKFRDDYEIK